jgi:hypothetical protein
MINLFLQHFRFYLQLRAQLRMPAYNKGNVIRCGFGSTFSADCVSWGSKWGQAGFSRIVAAHDTGVLITEAR